MRSRRISVFALALSVVLFAWLVLAPPLDDQGGLGDPAALGDAVVPTLEAVPESAVGVAPSARVEPPTEDPASRKIAAPAPDAEPQVGAWLTGRLVDPAAERPVVGALVLASPWPVERRVERADRVLDTALLTHLPLDVAAAATFGLDVHRATSDEEGRFEIATLPPGRFRIAVRSAAHTPWDRNDGLLAAGERLDLGEITLAPAVIVGGRVRSEYGEPVPDAELVRIDDFGMASLPPLSAAAGVRVETRGESGRFVTNALGPGRWRLLARASGFVEHEVAGQGSTDALDIVLEQGLDIAGKVAADKADRERLTVWAVPASATPVPFAPTERADARAAQVHERGTFALHGLRPDTFYDVRVVSPTQGFETESPWSPRRIALGGARAPVELVYRADAALSFEVSSARARNAIEALELALAGATPERVSIDRAAIDRGKVHLVGIRPSTSAESARLTLRALGFRRFDQSIGLQPGLESALGALALESLPVVEVTVTDRSSGRPIAQAEVHALEGSEWSADHTGIAFALSDERGIARVTTLDARDSSLEVRARGWEPLAIRGPFPRGASPGGRRRCEAALERGASARVRVVDLAGAPIAGEAVEHVPGEWTPNDGLDGANGDRARLPSRARRPSEIAVADAAGVCVFPHLARGVHAFRVVRPRTAFDGEWSLIEVSGEARAEVVLATEGHGRLALRLHDQKQPIAGALVSLVPASASLAQRVFLEPGERWPAGIDARTDANGELELENLVSGNSVLVLSLEGQGLRPLRAVRVRAGDHELPLDLGSESLTIAGRLIDSDGFPVADARVWVVSDDDEHDLRRFIEAEGELTSFDGFVQRFPATAEFPALRTDAHGSFRLRGVDRSARLGLFALAGTYGFASIRDLPERPSAEDAPLSIVLAEGGAIRARIVDPRLGARFLVTASPVESDALPRIARTISELPVTWEGIAPGAWQIRVWREGTRGRATPFGEPETLHVEAGETVEFERAAP